MPSKVFFLLLMAVREVLFFGTFQPTGMNVSSDIELEAFEVKSSEGSDACRCKNDEYECPDDGSDYLMMSSDDSQLEEARYAGPTCKKKKGCKGVKNKLKKMRQHTCGGKKNAKAFCVARKAQFLPCCEEFVTGTCHNQLHHLATTRLHLQTARFGRLPGKGCIDVCQQECPAEMKGLIRGAWHPTHSVACVDTTHGVDSGDGPNLPAVCDMLEEMTELEDRFEVDACQGMPLDVPADECERHFIKSTGRYIRRCRYVIPPENVVGGIPDGWHPCRSQTLDAVCCGVLNGKGSGATCS